jgi:steroid delta-isomerase-like uncharacterized protein
MCAACGPPSENIMNEEEGKEYLQRFMLTMMNADTALAEEMVHPDCEFNYPMLPKPVKGIDGYKELIMNMGNTFSDFVATIKEVNVKGDELWSRYYMTGIHSGPLGDIPPTGKRFEITGMAITRIKNGKIISDETYYNVLSFYRQLGIDLAPVSDL